MAEQEELPMEGEETELTQQEKAEVVRQQEAKLMQKYPGVGRGGLAGKPAGGPGGQSSFLQKRMAKNTKYFDSGDYQMDQQKAKGRVGAPGLKVGAPQAGAGPTGQMIPTPELVPARKSSVIQPRADHSLSHSLPGDGPSGPLSPGHAALSQLSAN